MKDRGRVFMFVLLAFKIFCALTFFLTSQDLFLAEEFGVVVD